jgi:hypothetical protein
LRNLYAIIGQRLLGSKTDLDISKSVLLYILYIFVHRRFNFLIWGTQTSVTSLPCWGRVVIVSLIVYQAIGAGSNPVASTTVLTVSARSIGNGQESGFRYAWEGLEKSGPFPILMVIGGTLIYAFPMAEKKVTGPASYFPSIEKKYGKPIEHWMKELKKVSKLAHMEQVAHLKEKFEMGHGHANAIVAVFRQKNGL